MGIFVNLQRARIAIVAPRSWRRLSTTFCLGLTPERARTDARAAPAAAMGCVALRVALLALLAAQGAAQTPSELGLVSASEATAAAAVASGSVPYVWHQGPSKWAPPYVWHPTPGEAMPTGVQSAGAAAWAAQQAAKANGTAGGAVWNGTAMVGGGAAAGAPIWHPKPGMSELFAASYAKKQDQARRGAVRRRALCAGLAGRKSCGRACGRLWDCCTWTSAPTTATRSPSATTAPRARSRQMPPPPQAARMRPADRRPPPQLPSTSRPPPRSPTSG